MDTFFTLVIALGGIATGIGAIWTATLARRQLSEQRRFLEEQNELARRQVQVSEQSLAQTERSLAEQNERSRLRFEMDMLSRMEERFDSPYFASRRRKAAKYILDSAFVEDDLLVVKVGRLPRSAWDVCNFYETLGELQKGGALQAESVWNAFGGLARVYWTLCEPAIENLRQKWKTPVYYEEFERLVHLGSELDSEQGVGPPTREQLYRSMEKEVVVGEEATMGEEPLAP
jgi:hypothetical protein